MLRSEENYSIDDIESEFKAPDSLNKPWDSVVVNGFQGRIVVASDWHIPWHDKTVMEAQVKFAQKNKADWFVVLGDSYDFHLASRFHKYREAPTIKHEIDTGKKVWKDLRASLGSKTRISVVAGNHDERLMNMIIERVPELKDLSIFDPQFVFGLSEYGIEWIGGRRGIIVNGLLLVHGHELGQVGNGNPKQPAEKVLNAANRSIMVGHFHKRSYFRKNIAAGGVMEGFVLGCGEELNPEWLRVNDWNHGFACIDCQQGKFYVRNYEIRDGEIRL